MSNIKPGNLSVEEVLSGSVSFNEVSGEQKSVINEELHDFDLTREQRETERETERETVGPKKHSWVAPAIVAVAVVATAAVLTAYWKRSE